MNADKGASNKRAKRERPFACTLDARLSYRNPRIPQLILLRRVYAVLYISTRDIPYAYPDSYAHTQNTSCRTRHRL